MMPSASAAPAAGADTAPYAGAPAPRPGEKAHTADEAPAPGAATCRRAPSWASAWMGKQKTLLNKLYGELREVPMDGDGNVVGNPLVTTVAVRLQPASATWTWT